LSSAALCKEIRFGLPRQIFDSEGEAFISEEKAEKQQLKFPLLIS